MLLSYYIPDIYFCDRTSSTVCGVCLSDLETSTMKRPRPGLGCGAKKKLHSCGCSENDLGQFLFKSCALPEDLLRLKWKDADTVEDIER